MVLKNVSEIEAATVSDENYDRTSAIKAFDETKAGVKGLVDAGITKVPRMFYSLPDNIVVASDSRKAETSIPVVALDEIDGDPIRRKQVVDIVREASEKWGFFQVVNHSIPVEILDEMLDGVRRFYDQDNEVKKQYYTRDGSKTVVYNSNFDLFRAASANWRDTTYVNMAPRPPSADELPEACRYVVEDIMLYIVPFMLLQML